ncbi:MAG: ribosome-associated translation inhibitor RaiA [Alistipes sp.]|jgi:ribosomal subunit interface protein|nr:ribosome-associated translation inhibitor RaiA [Alistipes sp.]MBR4843289.1 ribosome-associated translation inhibitor RaiA [Alistipes sp.]
MNVQIQSVKFDAGQPLLDFIQKKMDRLDRFVDDRAGDVEVTLRLDPDSEKGNKVVVVSLHVPGGDIRVEERAFTFEEAIDNSMDIIKRQLEKAKAKFEK